MTRHSRIPVTLLALAVLAGAGRGAAAQAPAERAALEAFRDSLAATSDTMGLRRLESGLIEVAKGDRDNPLAHLRLGFVALRLGDLGGKSHYEDAASEFQWAIDLRPDWPYPWYGMGLAELGVGDSEVAVVAGIATMLKKDALTRSATAFARSAAVDPAFVKGLVELANTALRQKVNIRLGVALEALRAAAGTEAARHPEVLLARGRVERLQGDPDSAVTAFAAYVEAPGAVRPLGQLELARTRLMAGDLAAREAFFAAAATDDSATVAGFRADLAPIVGDSVLREFDGTRGERRTAYLRRFWEDRDDLELRRRGERLAEHYRRLFYARRNFALATVNRQFDIAERYRSGSQDFDDRGIIYLRHGEPTSRASYNAPNVEPNESWRYARADGDLLFHFVARQDVQDFRLVESLFDVLGYAYAVRLQTGEYPIRDNRDAELLLASRERLDPVYQRLNAANLSNVARLAGMERQAGSRSITVGTVTDSYEPSFDRDLTVRTQVLAVGERDGRPLLQVAVALAGDGLRPDTVALGLVYPVRVRFSAWDEQGRIVASLDTTRYFLASQPVPKGEYLVGLSTVPSLGWGRLTWRLAVQQGAQAGRVLPREELLVAPPAAPRLTLSDLVLGARNARVTWRPAPADTVFFNPVGSFRRGEPLELYYELDGLPAGAETRTVLTVRKGAGGKGFLGIFGGSEQLSLRFTEEAPGGRWRIPRAIAIEKLKPGDYQLELAVTAPDGSTQLRKRSFRVAP